MRIGVSGHRRLDPRTVRLIESELATLLDSWPPPVAAVSSLAEGADRLFANAVLARRGSLEVVVPCRGYEASFSSQESTAAYRALRARASDVEILPFEAPTEDAYLSAGRRVVERSCELVAIWDGGPARGLGGTADVVAYARTIGCPVTVLWPRGAERS